MGCRPEPEPSTVSEPEPVSITVLDKTSVPIPGVYVMFHDADGRTSYEDDVFRADANGVVTAVVEPGTTATVLHAGTMVTFPVQEGDQIIFQPPVQMAEPAPLGRARVTLPAFPPDAVDYDYTAGCDNEDEGYLPGLGLDTSCTYPGTSFDVLATAFDVNQDLIGYSLATDLPVPSPGDQINVTMDPWVTSLQSANVSVTGLPDEASRVVSSGLDAFMDDVEFSIPLFDDTVPVAGTATFSADWPSPFQRFGLRLHVYFGSTSGSLPPSNITFIRRSDSSVVPSDIVLDAAELPPYVPPYVSDRSDPARPTIELSADRELRGDLAIAYIWRPSGTSWVALIPIDTTSTDLYYRYPELPDFFDALRPDATDDTSIALIDWSQYNGFDEAWQDLGPGVWTGYPDVEFPTLFIDELGGSYASYAATFAVPAD